jgi:sec-independent protein translocase protein TatA
MKYTRCQRRLMPFNIGPGELILVLVIVLIIFGPGKLPDIGSAIGKGVREFRKASTDLEDSIRGEPAPKPPADQSASTPAAGGTAPGSPPSEPK